MRIHGSILAAALAAVLAGAAACGGDTSTGSGGTTNTNTSTPTAVTITSAPSSTGTAGSTGGTFAVKVVDASGRGVAGVTVNFSATGSATVSPASAVTDASGAAATQVTLGTASGAATVRATATGIATPATANITVLAGPASKIVVNPRTLRFLAVGDTARVSAAVTDQFGNNVGTTAITYSSSDPTLVTVDAAGLVRVLRQPGTTFVVSSSGAKADTTVVTVLALGASACTGLVSATTMNVNDVQTLTGTQYACLSGASAGAEFAIVAFNSSPDATNALTASVMGNGMAIAPSASISPVGSTALRSVVSGSTTSVKTLDEDFHLRLMAGASDRFRGSFARTRLAKSATASRSITPTTTVNGTPSYSTIPSSAKVGDILTLNVSGGVCTGAENKGLRVAAVGTNSIVLADTLNPAGGFSATDYARFAARFDTLVYPLDVSAFGAPSDFDNNGRVAILFTRSVNELTPASSNFFVGGFFNPRDLFPKKGQTAADDCPGSNEGEMFYMLVPDPSGVVNGNVRTTGFVDSITTGILAHEFQHLISGSRRVYINPGAQDFEDSWLNEGLSHIAEELLYYRESGKSPRQNLNDATIEHPLHAEKYAIWRHDAASNFQRFREYLIDPGGNSPYADEDELATRGATWSFLRYAADRLGTTDGNLWQRFDNSVLQGMATLNSVYGTDVTGMFRDWNVANYLDDYGSTSDPRFLHQSWNFRDIFVNAFTNTPVYPIKVTGLNDNSKVDLSIRGGAASYLRFAIPAGKEGLLTFTSGTGLPSTPLQFVVVRTK